MLGTGACFGQTRISVGKASKRLTYVDQVLQLVYDGGSPCPSKTGQSYKSVFSFVCRPEVGPTNRPMLISLDKRTCTLFFSWHTPLACEQTVSPGRPGQPSPGGVRSSRGSLGAPAHFSSTPEAPIMFGSECLVLNKAKHIAGGGALIHF